MLPDWTSHWFAIIGLFWVIFAGVVSAIWLLQALIIGVLVKIGFAEAVPIKRGEGEPEDEEVS